MRYGKASRNARSAWFRALLLAGTAIAPAIAADVAMAQNGQPVRAGANAGVHNLDIPPQGLSSALIAFSRQTRVQIFVDQALASGKTSPGVSGALAPAAALGRLLGAPGPPLRAPTAPRVPLFRPGAAAPGGATPSGASARDTIDVQGAANPNSTMSLPAAYAGGQVASGAQVGMLGNRSVMNTPFSQTSYTNQTIKNQQALTLQDVLANDPSVITNTPSGGSLYGETTIRGFVTQDPGASGTLNGLMGMSPINSPDMDYVERVEVLRGPSALLNGMAANNGGIGGTVNLRTKQAGDEPLAQLTTRYISRGQVGAHVDFGQRFGDQKEFGVRFNGAFRKGDTPIEPQSAEVGSAALNLDYRGERVRLSADIAYQSNRARPGNHQLLAIPDVGLGVPRAPDAGTSLNPSWGEHQVKQTMAMVRGEVDITDNVTAYGAIGKQRYDHSYAGTLIPILLDTSGTYGWADLYNTHFGYDVLSMQGGLRATATTGPVDHKLSLDLSQSSFKSRFAWGRADYAPTTNLYDPVFGPAPVFPDTDQTSQSEQKRSGVAFADTMSILDERIQFTAGIRHQKVETMNSPGTGDAYVSDAWTPAFALVVKPVENVSVYANYIQALQPGQVVDVFYANAGQVLPPYLSEQYETGVKVDWGTVTTTLAVFQIAQAYTIAVRDPDGGLPRLAQGGEQRNRGIELNAYGEVVPGVRLMGGITLIDARLTKTENGLNDGDRAQGVPKFRTVVGAEWDTPFVQGLTLTSRASYTGEQMVYEQSLLRLPSYTTLDLGARYTFNSPWNEKPVTVRFNVDNVFDNNYWSAGAWGYLYLGSPRIFRLSAAFRF